MQEKRALFGQLFSHEDFVHNMETKDEPRLSNIFLP